MITTNDSLIQAFLNTSPKEAKLIITDRNGSSYTLTNAQIVRDGLEVNKYIFPSDKPCFGTCISSELTVSAYKTNSLMALDLQGATINAQIGILYNNVVVYIGIGFFNIDSVIDNDKTITLVGLDNIMKLDKVVNASSLRFPITITRLIQKLGRLADIIVNVESGLPNNSYQIEALPSGYDKLTYRQLLSWCCEIMGACAYCGYAGNLNVSWVHDYTAKTSCKITKGKRMSSTFSDPITITGVAVTLGQDKYLVGTEGYTINITDNPLITHDISTLVSNLLPRVGLTYVPCRISAIPMPYLEPFDMVKAVDKDDSDCNILVTDVTYGINCTTEIASRGEATERTTYASRPTFTNSQVYELNQRQATIEAVATEKLEIAQNYSELITNALGLYCTKQEQADGSVKYYMHDTAELTQSTNIFTMTSNGIAWTSTGWNNGNPTWSYGVSSAGDGFFRYISAQGISVSKAGQDYHIEVTPSAFSIYYQNMLVTQIIADTMNAPSIKATKSAQLGNIMFIPHYTNGTIDGTDIVYMK